MTDQIWDDRASAYVGAREALKAAQRIKVQARRDAIADPENGGFHPIELSDEYWSLLDEASILAQLARADISVGLLAGNYLVDQEQRIRRNRNKQRRDDVHARLNAARDRAEAVTTHDHAVDGAPFTNGHHVIVTRAGDYQHRTGYILQNAFTEGEVPRYEIALAPTGDSPPEREWFSRDDLELVTV